MLDNNPKIAAYGSSEVRLRHCYQVSIPELLHSPKNPCCVLIRFDAHALRNQSQTFYNSSKIVPMSGDEELQRSICSASMFAREGKTRERPASQGSLMAEERRAADVIS
jgi:hypothetical protein